MFRSLKDGVVYNQNNEVSNFWIKYIEAENKLTDMLAKSPVRFSWRFDKSPKEDKSTESGEPIYFMELKITYPLDELADIADIEFNRCAYESEWFKYVVNTGSDVCIVNDKNDSWLGKIKTLIFGPPCSERTYYYQIPHDFKIWVNFETEAMANKIKRYNDIITIYPDINHNLHRYVSEVYNLRHEDIKNIHPDTVSLDSLDLFPDE
jgi:hypothetical protein